MLTRTLCLNARCARGCKAPLVAAHGAREGLWLEQCVARQALTGRYVPEYLCSVLSGRAQRVPQCRVMRCRLNKIQEISTENLFSWSLRVTMDYYYIMSRCFCNCEVKPSNELPVVVWLAAAPQEPQRQASNELPDVCRLITY